MRQSRPRVRRQLLAHVTAAGPRTLPALTVGPQRGKHTPLLVLTAHTDPGHIAHVRPAAQVRPARVGGMAESG